MKKNRAVPFSKSPVLEENKNKWRSIFLMFFVLLLLASLIVRAAYLQIYKQDFLQDKGEARYSRNIKLPALRGRILDRNGEILAMSLPVKSIWADPEDATDMTAEELTKLAKLLDMHPKDIKAKMEGKKNFVYLKRQVEPEVSKEIEASKFPGIHQENTFKRYYANGSVNSHVTGFTDVEEVGQEGIELAFNKTLGGIDGERKVLKNRRGQVIEEVGPTIEPVNGQDVKLTIDNRIQYIAATALEEAVKKHSAKAASAVVLDAKTGEILALVNYPTYDPSTREGLTGEKLRNRAIVDSFEPGSIIKPFVVGLALEKNVVKENTVFETKEFLINGKSIHDAHGHPAMTVAQIIEKSSNIGTVKIGMKFQPKDIWDTYTGAGFGKKVGLGFPGESKGILRKPDTWKPIEQATMCFGHGLSVSLMQMAHGYLAFTNGGEVLPVSLVTNDNKEEDPKKESVRIFSESTAKRMQVLMEAVTSKGGTAPDAATHSYRVAGKTGTAHKVENGHYVNKYVGSFVGFAPVTNPRLIVAVSIDEPHSGHFGGVVSGPVFSKIVESSLKVLGVAPDKYEMVVVDGKKIDPNVPNIPRVGEDAENFKTVPPGTPLVLVGSTPALVPNAEPGSPVPAPSPDKKDEDKKVVPTSNKKEKLDKKEKEPHHEDPDLINDLIKEKEKESSK
jgi:cell division protein FtsI (penicillin-binding protein 3)